VVIGSKRNADPGSSCQVGGKGWVGVGSISMKRPLLMTSQGGWRIMLNRNSKLNQVKDNIK